MLSPRAGSVPNVVCCFELTGMSIAVSGSCLAMLPRRNGSFGRSGSVRLRIRTRWGEPMRSRQKVGSSQAWYFAAACGSFAAQSRRALMWYQFRERCEHGRHAPGVRGQSAPRLARTVANQCTSRRGSVQHTLAKARGAGALYIAGQRTHAAASGT